jgi:ECF sigma factor
MGPEDFLEERVTDDVSTEITRLLKAWSAGDQTALDQLVPKVYDELSRVARRYMRIERAGNWLQTPAVVNEIYLRLVDVKNVGWQDHELVAIDEAFGILA